MAFLEVEALHAEHGWVMLVHYKWCHLVGTFVLQLLPVPKPRGPSLLPVPQQGSHGFGPVLGGQTLGTSQRLEGSG